MYCDNGEGRGHRVCAKQKAEVLGARRATAELGKHASKVQLRERVTEKVKEQGKVASKAKCIVSVQKFSTLI